MPQYIINWDCGYGDSYEIVEANDSDEAEKLAYPGMEGRCRI